MKIEIDVEDLKFALTGTVIDQLNTIKIDGAPIKLAWVDSDGRLFELTHNHVGRVVGNIARNILQVLAMHEVETCETCGGDGVGLNGPCTTCRGHGEHANAVKLNTEASNG